MVDPTTGVITVVQPPRDAEGVYNVTVRVCDNGDPQLCGNGRVFVTVTAQNNFPPVWVVPRFNNESFTVTEVKAFSLSEF